MIESLDTDYEEIERKIWAGKYFSKDGAVKLAFKVYEESFWESDKKTSSSALMFASTLYGAFVHCIAQLQHLQLRYLFLGIKTLRQLNLVLEVILEQRMYKNFNSSQQEVLLAILLLCHYTSPFYGYRKMAIKLGEMLLHEKDANLMTHLLIKARFSRLWFYKKGEEYKLEVSKSINNLEGTLYYQENIDWRTIHRLSRLTQNKQMIMVSAMKANSDDVNIKSIIF